MIGKLALCFLVISFFAAVTGGNAAERTTNLSDFQKSAAKFHAAIRLPEFETTTNAVVKTVHDTIAAGNAALDRIAALDPKKASFENTLRALDDLGYEIGL